jgi:hypothetical protein
MSVNASVVSARPVQEVAEAASALRVTALPIALSVSALTISVSQGQGNKISTDPLIFSLK